jgi:hypothetical protein
MREIFMLHAGTAVLKYSRKILHIQVLAINVYVLLAKDYFGPLCTLIHSTCLYYHMILFYILYNGGAWIAQSI